MNHYRISVNCNLRNKLQWNLNQNYKIFIQENVFKNVVCEMGAILFWPHCVNFPWKNDNKHSIHTKPKRLIMGCLLWVKSRINVLSFSLRCCCNTTLLDNVITRLTSTDWKERKKIKVVRRYFIKWKGFFLFRSVVGSVFLQIGQVPIINWACFVHHQ